MSYISNLRAPLSPLLAPTSSSCVLRRLRLSHSRKAELAIVLHKPTRSNYLPRPPPSSSIAAMLLRPPPISGRPLSASHAGEPVDTGKMIGDLKICWARMKPENVIDARLKIFGSVQRKPTSTTKASKDPLKLTRELTDNGKQSLYEKDGGSDPFEELKDRFMTFKKDNYMENLVYYQNLAEAQAPKFMVIACADSRVCPSNILGFQPGEAFTVRNVANLVPPFEHGASETTAALEFAVNTLEVANILVVGHSRCGGIRALMSMKDEPNSRSFIGDWVSIAKSARLSTKAAAGNQCFDKQCNHCEKESVSGSLLNLLTYPWIKSRLNEGTLSLHGGYYNFVDCTFEKWTLVYKEGLEGGSKYAIKNLSIWS